MVQPRGPRREHSFSGTRDGGMARPHRQTAACDRCRGQKLRCMWDPKEPQCQRCQRADAVCTVPQPRPMGRPPRNHRGGSNSRDVGSTDNMYCWDEEINAPSDEEPAMVLCADALADPPDFLNYFRNPGALSDLFVSGGPIVTTSTMPALSTGSGDNNTPFSPVNDLFTSTTLIDYSGDKQGLDTSRELADDRVSPLEKRGNDHVQLLTRLCELNVALFQHPLHQEKDKTRSQKLFASDSVNHAPTGNPTGDAPLHDLSVADLGIGKLLQTTTQLKDIVTGLRSVEDGNLQKGEGHDRSTMLMALSCYTRLDTLYSRTIELLLQVQNGNRHLKDVDRLMFDLVIDGFSVNGCHNVQLDFLVYLYKQAHERIRSCIQSSRKSLLTIH